MNSYVNFITIQYRAILCFLRAYTKLPNFSSAVVFIESVEYQFYYIK